MQFLLEAGRFLYSVSLGYKVRACPRKSKCPLHTHMYSFTSVFLMLKNRTGDKVTVLKTYFSLGVVVHTFYPSTWEADLYEFEIDCPALQSLI